MARRPNAADVVTNKRRGRKDEAAAEADDGDQQRKPAEDQQHGLRIGALARRQVAAQRVDQIADRENAEPDGDDDRHHLGPHAVHRGGRQLARVPYQHRGKCRERQRNDHAGTIDAPRRRTLRKVRHDLTRPTDFSTSVTRAVSFFRKSANASPQR